MQDYPTNIVRRQKSAISDYSLNVLHLRNPLVVAWWSLVYPGFGHIREVSIAKGMFLFIGELLINTLSHLNLAIMYSFTGNFAMAKKVLDIHLLLIYCGILIFAVWDSYRIALEMNKMSVLADHEDAPLVPMVIGSGGLNAYEKRSPWVALAWSVFVPGAGHLYSMALLPAVFLMVGGAVIIYFSHLLPAVHYTMLGQFALAKQAVDWQWLLNVPSFYCFAIYDAYVKTVEYNKIFDREQAQFMRNEYQSPLFPMPL